jgi:hypothetical protein
VIARELARARCVIVIWTEASVRSSFVQAEAGRAHNDRKLIPVKAKGLTYKDIPLPFDNMYIEDFEDREKVLVAVVSLLARPQIEPSRIDRTLRQARFQLLSWFGIAGAAITLTNNLHGAITFSKWIKLIFDSWATILQQLWAHVLFFLPRVLKADALQLSLVAFVVLNIAMCSTKMPTVAGRKFATFFAIAVPAIIIVSIFLTGLTKLGGGWVIPEALGGSLEENGHLPVYAKAIVNIFSIISEYMFHTSYFYGGTVPVIISRYIVAFIVFVLLPLAPFIVIYLVFARVFGFHLNGKALLSRLWAIVVGFGLIVGVNYLSLWIEQQPWAQQIGK